MDMQHEVLAKYKVTVFWEGGGGGGGRGGMDKKLVYLA